MLAYGKLAKKPVMFRSFTGLDVSEFDSLYKWIEARYSESEGKRLFRDDRERRIGWGGRPFKLPLKDRLIMLLVYYRLYVTFTLAGFLFDIDQSSVCRDVQKLEPLVKECIPLPKKVYERARRARTAEEIEEYFPGFKTMIDATEQEIPRPKNNKKRKSHYSGKRKRHTVKTQLTVNEKGLITHKTIHARGRRHDYDIFKRNHPELPGRVTPYVDLGYDGIQKDFPELNAAIPFKRRGGRDRKGRELTPEQRLFNRGLSKVRVVVEHTISRMKKFNILGQEFRNRLRNYDMMTDVVSGLINMRIMGSKAAFA